MAKDEEYILGLCDNLLECTSLRQYTFDFLRGDAVGERLGKKLPVDAYYPTLKLVVEYREKQHLEPVNFFDKKQTISGMSRGEQRKLYDMRRRELLPKHGINLVEINYSDFQHYSNKRLLRKTDSDLQILEKKLIEYIKKQ